MNHDDAVKRAAEAEQVLHNGLFAKAFEDTRQALMNTWAQLDTVDERYREFAIDLHRKIKALDSVKRCLEHHIQTGQIARKEIDGRSRLRKLVG